ncbi:glycosyltransferase [Demequina subtropica]|uniref:glycosyltransferase n=1 Tax=Demequina subtropica TaxID=1638989 RepID=UPI000A568462|nr:glycosyltransferase [Demequina subtropica]
MDVCSMGRRVTFVGINYPPERTGIAPYTGAMARRLAERAAVIRVVTAQPHYPEWRIHEGYGGWRTRETLDGVTVDRVRHLVPRRPQGLPRLVSEVTFGVRAALSRWGRPQAVVLVSPALFSSAIAAVRARVRHRDASVTVWVQDLYGRGIAEATGEQGTVAKVVRAVEGRLLRDADRVVVIHDRFRAAVVADYGVDPDRVQVVRNWTHLPAHAPIDRAHARAERGWASETVVLHAGNMGVKQGLEHVVTAARLAQERGVPVRFVLLGDGGERARLEREAAGLRNIEFIRPLDDEAFRGALAAADVLLVHEAPGVVEMAVPSKLTSYFDAARPVVAATSPVGITAEEVRAARAGVVVESGDPAALVEAIVELTARPDRGDALGANGRAYRDAVLTEGAAVEAFASLLGIDAELDAVEA